LPNTSPDCELLGLLAEVLAAFGTVYALKPYLDCTMIPQDLDRVAVSHAEHLAENGSGARKRTAKQRVIM